MTPTPYLTYLDALDPDGLRTERELLRAAVTLLQHAWLQTAAGTPCPTALIQASIRLEVVQGRLAGVTP